MKLIVGLGNPGKEYEKSRHNIGFMVVDQLQQDLDLEPFHPEKKFKAEISAGEYEGKKIILAKPLTFMNLSGESVALLQQFYKVPLQDIWTIYDDLDLPLGQIRIRKEGSAGTHNGMKSIVSLIGSGFPRIRLGIESRGVTGPQEQETASFVLSPFMKEEKEILKNVLESTLKACSVILKEGIEAAMNKYNA